MLNRSGSGRGQATPDDQGEEIRSPPGSRRDGPARSSESARPGGSALRGPYCIPGAILCLGFLLDPVWGKHAWPSRPEVTRRAHGARGGDRHVNRRSDLA